MTSPDEPEETLLEKPFLDHLEDLRRTLICMAGALVLGMAAAIPLAPRVLHFLKAPLRRAVSDPDRFLRAMEVSGGFAAAMNIIFWTGLLISSPALVFFAARFVFPGLKRRERRAARRSFLFATALFAAGVAMCYRITLPAAIQIMLGVSEWMGIPVEFVTVSSYVRFALQLLIAFGLVFELPVALLVLGSVGLVNSAQLRRFRRHVIVALFIVAAVLTPPDVFSQLLMGVPLAALYEMCIWLLWWKERLRARGAEAR